MKTKRPNLTIIAASLLIASTFRDEALALISDVSGCPIIPQNAWPTPSRTFKSYVGAIYDSGNCWMLSLDLSSPFFIMKNRPDSARFQKLLKEAYNSGEKLSFEVGFLPDTGLIVVSIERVGEGVKKQ